ncbi:hypothetical protein [Variovorax sp. J31P207]|uniref:hypothetical protein n=1 Tax=Variovorax sp. J31P207 TaxID=3053510 RepID=UPI002578968B|nr:hypothetical protein [Variovorax sp. J31P207]MDM0069638.1 hypothetical protein [Variovorax sp. J31P207]
MRQILAFSAAAEAGTGIALMIAPSVVIPLLIRENTTDLAAWLGRFVGVALLSLGMACWPEQHGPDVSPAAFRAMLTYNTMVALLFGYVGAAVHIAGPLLWLAALLHVVIALLIWMRRRDTRHANRAGII